MGFNDRLEILFDCQKKLQKLFIEEKNEFSIEEKTDRVKDTILSLEDELHEILQLFPWKKWKNYSGNEFVDIKKLKEEIADALHFFINLCLICGIDSHELFDSFIHKNLKNIKRIENGINKSA